MMVAVTEVSKKRRGKCIIDGLNFSEKSAVSAYVREKAESTTSLTERRNLSSLGLDNMELSLYRDATSDDEGSIGNYRR